MMIKRAKLHSLEIRNYLGAGDQSLCLQLDGNHAVLCGPNGSGKTTLLSALGHLRRVNWTAALQSWSQGHNPSQVTLWDWFDVRPYFTAQLFKWREENMNCASFVNSSRLSRSFVARRRSRSRYRRLFRFSDSVGETRAPSHAPPTVYSP
jgi:predicted ATPase